MEHLHINQNFIQENMARKITFLFSKCISKDFELGVIKNKFSKFETLFSNTDAFQLKKSFLLFLMIMTCYLHQNIYLIEVMLAV